MTLCGPARDTVLTNRQTEKLNFDTKILKYSLEFVFFCQPWGYIIHIHRKKRLACNNVENTPEQYFAAHIVPG
jgi:hypothetical protein